MSEQPSVFVSYSHADTKWLKELDPHLKGLELYAKVERFDDRRLLGGDDWDAEVKAALDRADIVLLLVTANFIGSSYIHRVELPSALKRRAENGSTVIPILFEDCARKLLAIDDINYLPKDRGGALRPLAEWRGVQKTRGLTQITEHILAQIERLRMRVEKEAEASRSSGIDLPLYRKRAQLKWSAIDLSTLARPGAVDADITIRLSDVFIPQLARRSRPAVSLSRDYLEGQGLNAEAEAERAEELARSWEQLTPIPALDLAAECQQRHLVLLGDPGAGKSALVRYILLQLLNDSGGSDSPLSALSDHVPFLIELRDFVAREAEGRCTDLLGYLTYCGRELGFGFDASSLEHQLLRPSLLIIDGLDEIFDPRRRRLMVDQIIGLIGRYPQLRMLITSRIAGFDDSPFRGAEFGIGTLIDLTPDQIQEFANAWFTLVFPADPDAAGRARDDLVESLERRPQLRTIAGNPMILTIMATVARHRRLARSRAALYAQALELLCYSWDYKRGLGLSADSPLVDLQAEDTLLMLRRIAWRMQDFPDGLRANAITDGALRGVVEAFFKADWRFELPKARRAAGEMLKRLEERNWVLTPRGPALYGFVHRTFLEYLCALELSERFKAQQLDIDELVNVHVISRLNDDSWQEVLRLLAGSLPPLAAEQMLVAIVSNEPEATSDKSRWNLAWQSLAEIEPRFVPDLQRICVLLTDDLYAAAAAGRERDFQWKDGVSEAAQAIGRTAWPAPHFPTRNWPVVTTKSTSWMVLFSTLCDTIWNCSDLAFEYLKTLCRDGDAETRENSIWVLGHRYRDSADTFRLICSSAVNDPESDCRKTAVETLGEKFTDQPRTKVLLRARAVEDPDGDCRGEALRALAHNFSEDPETKTLLRVGAIEDSDGRCHGAALLSLAGMLGISELEILASEDLDGLGPGRDPRAPIKLQDIRKAAAKLNETEEKVRTLYQRLAEEVPLRFSRGVLKPTNPQPPKPRRVASSASASARQQGAILRRSVGGSGTASLRRRGRRGGG
jgi:hypothetical protein